MLEIEIQLEQAIKRNKLLEKKLAEKEVLLANTRKELADVKKQYRPFQANSSPILYSECLKVSKTLIISLLNGWFYCVGRNERKTVEKCSLISVVGISPSNNPLSTLFCSLNDAYLNENGKILHQTSCFYVLVKIESVVSKIT